MYYSTQIRQRKQDRYDLVMKCRSIFDRADAEKRDLTPEERSEVDQMNTAIAGHEQRIADLEKLNEVDAPEVDAEPEVASAERSRRVGTPMGASRSVVPHDTPEYRSSFEHYLRTGERRDGLTVGTQTAGGYLILPVQLSNNIIVAVDNDVQMRQVADVQKLSNAQAIGVRQITARLGNPNMMTEIQATDIDSTLAFGRRDLTPNLSSRTVKVSDKELALSADILGVVQKELTYAFGQLQENKFTNGSGTGEPLGDFVASANGIPTSQDYESGTLNDFTADDLIGMRYNLPQNYFKSKSCRWKFSRTIAAKIRKLKDSEGRYIWQPGLLNATPDMLLDVPVMMSEFAPSVLTGGSYVAVLGDYAYYSIAEVGELQIKRLEELYAGTHQVGFRASWFFDGAPTLGAAYTRLKTKAS